MSKSFISLFVFLALAVSGCASTGKTLQQEPAGKEEMRTVHADLVEEMIRQGNVHAALAHIDELQRGGAESDRIQLLKGRVLFSMGRIQEAHAAYVKLMGGPLDAEAMHGIGLIYAINDPQMSEEYLGKAARGKPTDAGIRNDYGYALLKHGEFSGAQQQLVTAHELSPGDVRYSNNALLALFVLNDEQGAQSLIRRYAIPDTLVKQLRHEAIEWRKTASADTKSTQTSNAGAKPAGQTI